VEEWTKSPLVTQEEQWKEACLEEHRGQRAWEEEASALPPVCRCTAGRRSRGAASRSARNTAGQSVEEVQGEVGEEVGVQGPPSPRAGPASIS